MPRFVRQLALVAIVTSALVNTALCDQIMLDDFNSPPIFAAEVDGTSQYNTWIPTLYNNGTTLDSITTVQNNVCLKYMDWDGPDHNTYSSNGVYKIIPNAFPTTGQYRLRMRLKTAEFADSGYSGYRSFILGYTVNGTHRLPGKSLSPLPAGQYVTVANSYLTNNDDSGKPWAELKSEPFSATAGDSLRLVLSSYYDLYSFKSAANKSSYMIVEDIKLDTDVSVPVALSAWTLE